MYCKKIFNSLPSIINISVHACVFVKESCSPVFAIGIDVLLMTHLLWWLCLILVFFFSLNIFMALLILLTKTKGVNDCDRVMSNLFSCLQTVKQIIDVLENLKKKHEK